MSARYSTSPALILPIARSRLRARLYALLGICLVASVLLIVARGHSGLALVLLVPGAWCYVGGFRGDTVAALSWREGRWALHGAGGSVPIEVLPGSCCPPWGVCLRWAEVSGGRRGVLWVFADSAPPDALRRLRVRLSLQR